MFRPELLKLEYGLKAAVQLGFILTYIDGFIIVVVMPFRTEKQSNSYHVLTKAMI